VRHCSFAFAIAISLLTLSSCDRGRPEAPTGAPVRTELARRASFTPSLTLLGVVRAAESIPLAAQQHGTIRYPRRFAGGLQTGARVSRGEVVAEVDNDELITAQRQAQLQMDAAAADLDRAERSYKGGVISAADYEGTRLRAVLAKEQNHAAVRRVSTLQVIAPASGTLVVTKVIPGGSLIDASAVLAEVATGGAPLVESSVAASERSLLRPGLAATFLTRATPPWTGSGRIAEVAATVSDTGTSRVVATITPNGGTPPPGTGVEVAVQLEPRGAVLTVPDDAIVAGVDGPALFVAASAEGSYNFRVKRVAVVTAGRASGRVEITAGLHDGDRVVVSGADALSEGSLATEVGDKARP
jgi:RND family efflux transporter MFP subunit